MDSYEMHMLAEQGIELIYSTTISWQPLLHRQMCENIELFTCEEYNNLVKMLYSIDLKDSELAYEIITNMFKVEPIKFII